MTLALDPCLGFNYKQQQQHRSDRRQARRRRQQQQDASFFRIGLMFVMVVVVVALFYSPCHAFSSSSSSSSSISTTRTSSTPFSVVLFMNNKRLSPREEEIQRKILQLKRQGRVPSSQSSSQSPTSPSSPDATKDDTNVVWSSPRTKTDYTQKLQSKLGVKKSRFLGLDTLEAEVDNDNQDNDDDDDDDIMQSDTVNSTPILGSLAPTEKVEDEILTPLKAATTSSTSSTSTASIKKKKQYNINPDLYDDDDEASREPSEQDLVELVEKKLLEKRRREMEWEQKQKAQQEQRRRLQEQEQQQPVGVGSSSSSTASRSSSSSPPSTNSNDNNDKDSSSNESNNYITTGVGGNWNKNASVSAKDDLYVPSSSGSWGAFPRPRDISKAYGGGRQVKPGSTATSNEDATRERLRQYRERVGIEVQSEKDHALEIDEALRIASYAMQRGVYASAVSALEKVTKHCSTNSKVGGKVFLELAMAYEAVGRSGEAMTVYRTLSSCRIEDIKFNAKRLLYGMEAMQFMRDEAKSADFSRKKIRNTFIDTTGLANIAQQFDDVYQTAYIDLNSNFYRRLTESVVRSNREARQILLKATGSGEVDRLKIVQALRSLSRNFETALEKEIRVSQPKPEPVALMNGKPIVPDRLLSDNDDDDDVVNDRDLNNVMNSVDEFALATAEQMMENLQGEWRLQLIADRRGDGVKYFNSSLSWQSVDTNAMTFQSSGSVGFLTMSQSGEIEFDMTRRVLKRNQVRSSGGGGMLTSFLWANPKDGGVVGAICSPQQIMSVDSILLITQCAASATRKKDNADKDHYAVWRRVEAGTYSKNARD